MAYHGLKSVRTTQISNSGNFPSFSSLFQSQNHSCRSSVVAGRRRRSDKVQRVFGESRRRCGIILIQNSCPFSTPSVTLYYHLVSDKKYGRHRAAWGHRASSIHQRFGSAWFVGISGNISLSRPSTYRARRLYTLDAMSFDAPWIFQGIGWMRDQVSGRRCNDVDTYWHVTYRRALLKRSV